MNHETDGRDRVEYNGLWMDGEKAQIEAAFDVVVDDPLCLWRHGKPRIPRTVDALSQTVLVSKQSNGRIAFKRWTEEHCTYFTTLDAFIAHLAFLYRPALDQNRDE